MMLANQTNAETAQEKAARLMGEVDKASQQNYSRSEVKTILNAVAHTFGPTKEADDAIGCRAPAELAKLQRGDVFIHKLVGGKVRPWVVLRVDGQNVVALSLSSGDNAPGMTKSECRLWPSNWIGSSISVISMELARQEVVRPYTNLPHLAEVERSIAARYGFPFPEKQKPTMASIRAKVASHTVTP